MSYYNNSLWNVKTVNNFQPIKPADAFSPRRVIGHVEVTEKPRVGRRIIVDGRTLETTVTYHKIKPAKKSRRGKKARLIGFLSDED
jgi:hypothetical protein